MKIVRGVGRLFVKRMKDTEAGVDREKEKN